MRHRYLTVTVAIVLIGLVSGQQYPLTNGFQSSNFASAGNNPQALVNSGNLQNNALYNPSLNLGTVQDKSAASASFLPQNNNQPPNNNLQNGNSNSNPTDLQISPADYMKYALENDPIIKQFLQDPTNRNPAQLFQNSQNGFPIPQISNSNSLPNVNLPNTVPGSNSASTSSFPQINNQPPNNNLPNGNSFPNPTGSQISPADYMKYLLENNPIIDQFLRDSKNRNSETSGTQFLQNSQNGFPDSYESGSNPLPNVNPANTVPLSNSASASFFPQISNQSPNNQGAKVLSNPVSTKLSPGDYMKNLFENDPIIKQFLQGPTNTNPVTNGGQPFQNSQNGFLTSYASGSNPLANVNPPNTVPPSDSVSASFFPQISNQSPNNNFQGANALPNPVGPKLSPGDYMKSLFENDPIIKQFLQGPTNRKPAANGVQPFQNAQNGFPIPYESGSNSFPNVNPPYTNNARGASFIPQINNQLPVNNFQSRNYLANPVSMQLPLANSAGYSQENNPLIKNIPQGPRNANLIPNGSQLIQNSQNAFPYPYLNGPNPYLSNLNTSDTVLGSKENTPFNKDYSNDPVNKRQVINQGSNSLSNLPNFVSSSRDRRPPVKKKHNKPKKQKKQKPPKNKAPAQRNKIPNPSFKRPNPLPNPPNAMNQLVTQFQNNPSNQRFFINRGYQPIYPWERFRHPFPVYPNYFPDSNSGFNAVNYNTGMIENPQDGNKPFNSPTISSSTDNPSNNPTLSYEPTITTSKTSKKRKPCSSKSSALSSTNSPPDYSLPSDVPLEYPKSDFPKGFFLDMVKSLETNSKNSSTVGAIQPKRRKKCKLHLQRTGIKNSSKSSVAATTVSINAGSTTMSSIKNVESANKISDSSLAGTKLTTAYSSDILKQSTTANIRVINSLRTSKDPNIRKRKCKKRRKIKVTGLESKTPSFSELTSAGNSLFTITPQILNTKSVTIDAKNTNQNSNLTTVGLSNVQHKKKKNCSKIRNKKSKSKKPQREVFKGQSDTFPSTIEKSVEVLPNLSNRNNNDTNFRSSDKRQKLKKCQRKKGRMKTLSTKGLSSVSIAEPTKPISASLFTVSTAAPTKPVSAGLTVASTAGPPTTISKTACGENQVWWDCKPLNNTCRNFARGKSQTNPICETGCFCDDDFVQDEDGSCVDPDDCAAPVCIDEDHEELTDCLIECNRCEDDCHPCQMSSCVDGCDCKDGYKRDDNGTCVLDKHCPPCPTTVTNTPVTDITSATNSTGPTTVTNTPVTDITSATNSTGPSVISD